MATGAAPALEPKNSAQKESEQTLPPKPKSFMERLAQELTEIFEPHEKTA
jgi:hypothetical protein